MVIEGEYSSVTGISHIDLDYVNDLGIQQD